MRDLVIYLIGINVLTFLIYGIDKWKARRGKWRIPEDTLLGMYLFRHKTQHRKFTLGVPAILLVRQPKRQRLFHRRASHRPTGGKIRLPAIF